jgi:hypothetical protein
VAQGGHSRLGTYLRDVILCPHIINDTGHA